MLKLSLKEGQYVNIGDDIRIVFSGEAQKEIQRIIWKEKARQKKTQRN